MTIFVTFCGGGELSDTGWHGLCMVLRGHAMAWQEGSFGTFVPKSRDEKKALREGHCGGLGGSGAPKGTLYDVFGDTEGRGSHNDGKAVGDTAR